MSENKTVSIVVPVYNVEDYLDSCIRSLVSQTYSNIEILLVNDGSVDGSLAKCRDWERRDTRIRVYDQDNHGVSYARNVALNNCQGTYISFVDADDLIAENYIETLVALLEKDNADLVTVSSVYFSRDEELNYLNSGDIAILCTDLETIFYTHTQGCVWGKLYRKSIITECDLRFDEDIAVTEDLLFNMEYVARSRTVVCCEARLYGYRQRAGSAVHNNVSPRWFTCLQVYRRLLASYQGSAVFPYIVSYYLKNLYEAKYLIGCKKVQAPYTIHDIIREIRRVEKNGRHVLPEMKVKLFICKHFFFLVDIHRR